MLIEKADRIHRLAVDPMEELERARRRAERRGFTVIDFTGADPDVLLPEGAPEPEGGGTLSSSAIRRAVAERFRAERGVRLDPEREILLLPHARDAFRLFALGFVDHGEVALLPDPGDPAYRAATTLAGGWPIGFPLHESRRHLPGLDRIEPEAARRARLLFIGYPARPLGAAPERPFYDELVRFARRNNIVVVQDATLAGAVAPGETPAGLLDHPEGRELGVEVHDLAPLFDCGGWRPGFAAGNREMLFAARTLLDRFPHPPLRTSLPLFRRVLDLPEEERRRVEALFRSRVDRVTEGLASLSWEVERPRAGHDLWVRVPQGTHSMRFASLLLRRAGVAVLPGALFGEFGHGHVLIRPNRDEASIDEALDRLRRMLPARRRVSEWFRRRRELLG